MSPSRPFIERPVATALLMLAIVLAGLVGFRFLPLSALPQVDYPTIQVQTLYPGASPEVMSRNVTAPLERQFGQMPGLARMASTSAAGVSIVTLQFDLGLAIDIAEQEVQAAINAGSSLLPTDLPAPPVYAKVNPADAPVLTMAISSDTLPLTEVQNLVNTRLAQKISQVPGVGLVTLAGGQRPAVRIQADTKALASYGIGLDTLRSAISAANANSAKGSFDGPQRAYTINANDQLLTVDDYKRLIVSWKNGAPVRMIDVARVVNGAENDRLRAWAGVRAAPGRPKQAEAPPGGSEPGEAGSVGATEPPPGRPKAASAPPGGSEPGEAGSVGAAEPPPGRPKAASAPPGGSEPGEAGSVGAAEPPPGRPKAASAPPGGSEPGEAGSVGATLTPAIILNVQRQPGANVISTVDSIRRQLPELQAGLPAGLDVQVLSDRTTGIRASVHHVEMELVLAVLMVVLVIFFFLHSLRATVIASLAVPISLIGTCGVMYLLGYSLNNLSLMALTIATGFVVDDAIVMIENIARYIEEGEPPFQAALKGATQIGFTIISLTVSLIAVLIPLLFMSDVVGRLFREFAVTLALTILISAVVSLTLVPMMSARWLRALPDTPPRGLGGAIQRGFDRVIARYDVWLQWVLRREGATLAVALLTLALTVVLYVFIPKGLFPTQDTGQLQGRLVAAQDVSFERMSGLQQEAVRALLQDPDVASISSFVGVDGANNAMLNTGRLLINLREGRDRQEAVMQRLRERADAVAGVTLYLQPTQDLTIDAETGPTEYRATIGGVDSTEVNAWTNRLVERLRTVPQVRNATTDAGAQGLSAFVDIDRATAARLSVTASAVDDTLYSAFGQRIVSTIFTETNQYRVILEAQQEGLSSPEALGTLPLRTGSGAPTPLSAVATVREQPAPLQITRVAQYPAATLGFDKADGVSLGEAVDAIRAAAQEIGMPAGLSLQFQGAAGAYEKSLASQLWLILAAMVCVYIVLGVLYESYVHPLTILSTLPSAGVGALLALMLTGNDLGVIGIIGIILLIGIVKKNAIMMIDFAIDAERGQGLPPRVAIHQAALLRFRPILMTTLAALFAALPLMLGWGEGAELRRPLGLAIFGGLVLSQLLTLFTTPVIYLAFDRLGRRWTGRGTAAAPEVPTALAPPAAPAGEGRP
ncbi:efflux RND transporter permease subunit [Paracidovorax citrulli]|uniref:efflux RND transporter permease subunit n=2 Tax=Paracidovorax citrulli TaxID=80869 RepID=UPI001D18FC7B|nr:efflux RND transporter permease subunit [Paracidovorax citrulli]UEG47758.1 efflux RND transporter permease subunit [Paracidovorax citrulli]UMT88991.1 multidrug transporter subunit MdtC [Paracidovorax citrulli]UMT96290.1 multidrug transporter subunit MdtC [Paracidovorax citrulli]WIY36264.1 efflux RND transporter permease subunit [Paracidovorax citrulli]